MGTVVNEKMMQLCGPHLQYCQYTLLFIYVESLLCCTIVNILRLVIFYCVCHYFSNLVNTKDKTKQHI